MRKNNALFPKDNCCHMQKMCMTAVATFKICITK